MAELVQSIFPALTNSIFEKYGEIYAYTHTQKSAAIPFKDHPQLNVLTDILTRKNTHHLHIIAPFSKRLYPAFLESLLNHLTHHNPTKQLRQAEIIYLPHASFWQLPEQVAATCFEQLNHILEDGNQPIILALNHPELMLNDISSQLSFVQQQFLRLLSHPNCRFIFISQQPDVHLPDETYTRLKISSPTHQDIIAILKQQRLELENHHHVAIPDELLLQTYTLAERYLSTQDTLNQTLLLLDSSAARTAGIEGDPAETPSLTLKTIMQVLSDWTSIPSTHLSLHRFKLAEFITGIEQRIFGQEQAMNLLGHEIQRAQARLQDKQGPFCSILLVGHEHTGKKTTALALTEQLFKQINLLHTVQPSKSTSSLLNMMTQPCGEKRFVPIKELIHQKPNAVILFEAIESLSTTQMNELLEMLGSGYLHDEKGHAYNFCQAVIILTTNKGAAHLSQFIQPEDEPDRHQLNLMQLILNEQTDQIKPAHHEHSPDELIRLIKHDLENELPTALIEHCPIIPFLPLNKTAVEQIMRLKLKVLDKQLHLRFGFELGYAPEVIRYLANAAQDHQSVNIEKALKPLYFTIEQAVLARGDQRTRLNQLFLQLNETGQVLRCDWLIGPGSI